MSNMSMIRENALAYKAKKQSEADEWAKIGQQLAKSLVNDFGTITGDDRLDNIVLYLLEDTPVATNNKDMVCEDNDSFISDL